MIFILGCHKSGTSFLRSLLDSHPELFVIPYETHFFESLGIPSQNAIRNKIKYSDVFNERLKQVLTGANTNKNQMADVVLPQNIQLDFSFDLDVSEIKKDHFLAYAISLGNELDITLGGKMIVEKSVENYEFASFIKKIIPEAKFIHILRNPYANLVSLRKFKREGEDYPSMVEVFHSLKQSFFYAKQNSFYLSDYHILKYEDLLLNPKIEMKTLSSFLGIEYIESSLLKPTLLGNDWQGNSSKMKKFNGINKEQINNWINDIYPNEIEYVNRFLRDVCIEYGYDELIQEKNPYYPNKKENLKTFIRNRAMMWFESILSV